MSNPSNHVQLIGHIGADLVLQHTKSGASFVKFSMATNEQYTSSKGELVKDTQWHRIVAWGNTAELMSNFLTKGSQVLISGKLTYNSYEDKEGITKYVTEIKCNKFKSLNKEQVAP